MDEYEFASRMLQLEKATGEKHPMWYALHIHGVWCRGKHARCYAGNTDACHKCQYYDGRGVNN